MPTPPLITAADIRAYLDDIEDGDAANALLTTIAGRATDIVYGALAKAMGQPFVFGYTPGTRIVRGYGTSYLFLPPHEPGSVSAVTWGAYTVPVEQYQAQPDGSLYRVAVSGLISYGLTGWGSYDYAVTANWGYGDPPEAVIEVCLEVAVNIWRSKDKGMFSEIVGVEGANGLRFTGGLTRQQQDILAGVIARQQPRIPTI